MNINDLITNLVTPSGFMGLLQMLIIVLEALYIFYAFILVRQVKLMNESVQTQFGTLFTAGALLLFLASLAITALSILTL